MPQRKRPGRGARERSREKKMASIKCGKCAGTHASVREVRLCYVGSVVKNAVAAIVVDMPEETRAPAPAIEPATEGMYLFDGRVFKVQRAVHGSGHLYAKELDGTRFEYAPGMMRKLNSSHKMTLDQAKEYGALYGVCCQCGRTLTNEASIEAGIGPVCATKF
jgi:hypothetical protein